MGSLEVVSKETFQQQLEGMSSCAGCRKERLKEVATRKLTRRSRKGSHIKSNSPIVVRLRDTIRASAKGKLREAFPSSDVESDLDSSDENSTASPHSTSSSHHGSTSSTPPESPRDRSARRPKGLRISRMRRARKDGKNFNAFLSAIEKVHSKERGFHLINNLSHQYNWHSKEHKNSAHGFVPHGELLLNNVVAAAYQNSLTNSLLREVSGAGPAAQFPPPSYHHICSKPKAFDSINRDKVDLICNDLTSESYESMTSLDDSENASVISSSDSLSESDGSSGAEVAGEELTKEELERLAEFTTGCPLRRYSCPPHECPECLATYYAYTKYYSSDLLNKADSDHKADTDATDREGGATKDSDSLPSAGHASPGRSPEQSSTSCSESEPETVDIKPKCVEVSVASFFEKPARRTSGNHGNKQPDTVTVDITDSDVTFTVSYPPVPGETFNPDSDPDGQGYGAMSPWPSYYDFYNNFYQTMLGFMPFLIPAYWVPPFYPPWSYPPMVVPRPMSFKDCNNAAFKDTSKCLLSNRGTQTQENRPFTATAPPQRPWIPLAHPDTNKSVAIFTVMCYNVLCDKYATRQLYGYCPSWALNWEYRKKIIIEEIRQYSADIISLQEVETEQFYQYFLPELKQNGYDGVFAPKSRARTMAEVDRKHVDGCAIFYQTEKFKLVKEYLIEFNQLAISTADGSHDMINRVMTKDNIGLAALLETKASVWENGLPAEEHIKQHILVSTCHVHWDPEFCDVKLIQTMMLMSELKNIIQDTQTSLRPGSTAPDVNRVPLILCGDLNSLPESGVVDFLNVGRVSAKHDDFKGLGYEDCLRKLSITENKDMYTHGFKLSQAYANDIMPYTNYTYDFKGIIDYIFYSRDFMRPLGLLGPLDQEWFKENKVFGCPHPQIPSDHLPLLTEFEMLASHSGGGGVAENSRRLNTVPARR